MRLEEIGLPKIVSSTKSWEILCSSPVSMGTDQGATNNSLHTQSSAPFSLNKNIQASGRRDLMERVRSQIGLWVSLLEYSRLWKSLEVKFQTKNWNNASVVLK